MASGRPVIAYGKGGVLETVVPMNQGQGAGGKGQEEKPTGIFFYEQRPEAVIEAVQFFEKNQDRFDCNEIRRNAERFSKERFKREFREFVNSKIEEWDMQRMK